MFFNAEKRNMYLKWSTSWVVCTYFLVRNEIHQPLYRSLVWILCFPQFFQIISVNSFYCLLNIICRLGKALFRKKQDISLAWRHRTSQKHVAQLPWWTRCTSSLLDSTVWKLHVQINMNLHIQICRSNNVLKIQVPGSSTVFSIVIVL